MASDLVPHHTPCYSFLCFSGAAGTNHTILSTFTNPLRNVKAKQTRYTPLLLALKVPRDLVSGFSLIIPPFMHLHFSQTRQFPMKFTFFVLCCSPASDPTTPSRSSTLQPLPLRVQPLPPVSPPGRFGPVLPSPLPHTALCIVLSQCKEIEGNNRMGKTRDLFKKIRDTKGTFHANMGSIKDRNGRDLTEAEDIKKRWQEYT